MKSIILFSIAIIMLFCGCTQERITLPLIDKDQASAKLMKELAPQLVGNWSMSEIRIKHQNSTFHHELKIKNDTILTDFATLSLTLSDTKMDQAPSRYEGYLRYGNNSYPIRMELLAGPWIFNQKGPKAFFLLDSNFPIGSSHIVKPEEYYLQQIGLLFENFSLEVTAGEPTMIWRGLNRGIEQIRFSKK
jgi:hypothetical protein